MEAQKVAAEMEAQKVATEERSTMSNSERMTYWEELLEDRYEVHKIEEFNALGKGKRISKQMVSIEEDDLAGMEDVSTEGKDYNYEADLTDSETTSGTQTGRKPCRKRSRVDNMEPVPLMEGERRSFRVLGFNQNQRAAFVQILMRHGYGRWQAIVDDKDLKIQEIICQELNLPFIDLSVPGQASSQSQKDVSTITVEAPSTQVKGSGNGISNDLAADVAQGTTDAADQQQMYQDSSILSHFRDMQRRQVEFIKKRVMLLEKGLNAEYQKEYYCDDPKSTEVTGEEPEGDINSTGRSSLSFIDIDAQMIEQLPQIEPIKSEEISAAACDDDPDRLELPQLYNKVCNVLEKNIHQPFRTSLTNQAANLKLRQDLLPLETICEHIIQILSPLEHKSASELHALDFSIGPADLMYNHPESRLPSIKQNNDNPSTSEDIEMIDITTESELQKRGSVL